MSDHSKLTISHLNNVQLGAEEEAKGNLKEASKYYEAAIKDERPDELPFNRLMVIYRKQKMYEDELRVIKKGIKKYEDFYKGASSKSGRRKKRIHIFASAFLNSMV